MQKIYKAIEKSDTVSTKQYSELKRYRAPVGNRTVRTTFGVSFKSRIAKRLDDYRDGVNRSLILEALVEKFLDQAEKEKNDSSAKRIGKTHRGNKGDLT